MNTAPVHPAPQPRVRQRAFMVKLIVTLAFVAVIGWLLFSMAGHVYVEDRRVIEGSNLRSIGGTMLAAENDHPGVLSSVNRPNIHAYAAQLARFGLNNPYLWLSRFDAANPYPTDQPTHILAADPTADDSRPINPQFQNLPLAFAVALFPPGTDITKLPVTTPLAWTRGLQPDGTWSETHAPYGDWGGHIVFAGGNLEKFKTIDGKLVKFGTTQPTSDIREALPPGTRILESPPNPQSR
jgi:hypothetical protein